MNSISVENTIRQGEQNRLHLTEPLAEKINCYMELLLKWNSKMNLVGANDWRTLFDTLLVDSIYLAEFLKKSVTKSSQLTLDLGAGAGLPGIVLRMLWTVGEYHLVELREKRAIFMEQALSKLALAQTHVFAGRAEDAFIRYPKADIIVSKAFMPWQKLLPFVNTAIADDGLVVVLSNEQAPKEIAGWKIKETFSYKMKLGKHYFWLLEKE